MATPNDATESFTNLDRVIAEYLQAIEAGQVPNREDLLDRHPELAEPLRAFFADFDRGRNRSNACWRSWTASRDGSVAQAHLKLSCLAGRPARW